MKGKNIVTVRGTAEILGKFARRFRQQNSKGENIAPTKHLRGEKMTPAVTALAVNNKNSG